jgi:tRNA-2-methylthio-N6-dimethylallyladenosine synthase
MADQIPRGIVQARYERLTELQDRISWEEGRSLIGREVEVLISRGEGRKDVSTGRVSGRARDGRLVHVAVHDESIRPGDTVTSTVTYAAPHHLVADSPTTAIRRWTGDREPHVGGARPTARPMLTIGARPAD